MHFKIDWATLIVGRKFAVFALFYFVFEGNFPSTVLPGAYIWKGERRFNGRFIALPIWGAHTWTGLFSEFYGILVVGKYRLWGYHDWGTFLWLFTVVPREIEDINAYPKFWGAKKVSQDYMC